MRITIDIFLLRVVGWSANQRPLAEMDFDELRPRICPFPVSTVHGNHRYRHLFSRQVYSKRVGFPKTLLDPLK